MAMFSHSRPSSVSMRVTSGAAMKPRPGEPSSASTVACIPDAGPAPLCRSKRHRRPAWSTGVDAVMHIIAIQVYCHETGSEGGAHACDLLHGFEYGCATVHSRLRQRRKLPHSLHHRHLGGACARARSCESRNRSGGCVRRCSQRAAPAAQWRWIPQPRCRFGIPSSAAPALLQELFLPAAAPSLPRCRFPPLRTPADAGGAGSRAIWWCQVRWRRSWQPARQAGTSPSTTGSTKPELSFTICMFRSPHCAG